MGGLLASQQAAVPSVILYRRRTRRRPHELVMILLANIATVQEDLEGGAIVVIEDHGMRVRPLTTRVTEPAARVRHVRRSSPASGSSGSTRPAPDDQPQADVRSEQTPCTSRPTSGERPLRTKV